MNATLLLTLTLTAITPLLPNAPAPLPKRDVKVNLEQTLRGGKFLLYWGERKYETEFFKDSTVTIRLPGTTYSQWRGVWSVYENRLLVTEWVVQEWESEGGDGRCTHWMVDLNGSLKGTTLKRKGLVGDIKVVLVRSR